METIPVATLLAGEFFGEMALLSANPRTATVTAVTHCTLHELTRTDVVTLALITPAIEAIVQATADERTQNLAGKRAG